MDYYAFEDKVLLIDAIPIDGFGEGDDVIQGSRRVDTFNDQVGAGGNMLVWKTSNKSGVVVLRLQQTSSGNAVLNAIQKRNESLKFAPVTLAYTNTGTGESITGTRGYIAKVADITRGEGVNDQEWTIVVENYEAFFGLLGSAVGIASQVGNLL